MTAFAYTAKTRDGQTVEAQLEAFSRVEALAALRAQGLTILNLAARVNERAKAKPKAIRAPRFGMFQSRIPLNVLTSFCRQLAISVKAGVPLRDALESIEEDEDHKGLRYSLRRVIVLLGDGVSFSEALRRQGKAYGNLFVSLMKSAEESGSMDEALARLADYLERSDQLSRKIRSITTYPVFVAGFFVLVCAVMTVWVLPRFQGIFSGFNAELPLITRMVFGFNEWMLSHAVWVGTVIAGVFVTLALVGRLPGWRLVADRVKLKIPVLGGCWQKIAVSRFCRNLSIMTRGGVPISSGIEIAAKVCGNVVLENALNRASMRIVNGSEIAPGMRKEKSLPRMLIRMLAVGEQSGQVPEVLDNVADTYEKQVEGTIVMTMSLLEPAFICLFGILILIMILAIYVPIFTVSTHV